MSSATLLCDPGLVIIPNPDASIEERRNHWFRLVEWLADPRLGLGAHSYLLVLDLLERHGWPDLQPPGCPEQLRSPVNEALGRLLTRVIGDISSARTDLKFRLDYLLPAEFESAYASDVALTSGGVSVGAASARTHWGEEPPCAGVLPPPPDRFPLHFRACEQTEIEQLQRLRSSLSGKRITVVGGKASEASVQLIGDELGSCVDVRWLKTEKKARANFDALEDLSSDRDLVVCVTGKIGHAEWKKAERMADAGKVPFLEIEKPSQAIEALRAHCA